MPSYGAEREKQQQTNLQSEIVNCGRKRSHHAFEVVCTDTESIPIPTVILICQLETDGNL